MKFPSMVHGFETLQQRGSERFFKTVTKFYIWDQDILIHKY